MSGIQAENGVLGIANIPNQTHQISSYKTINFNVALYGELNGGKTSLINRIFKQNICQNNINDFENNSNQPVSLQQQQEQIVDVRARQFKVTEDGVEGVIRLIDCPLVGYSTSKQEGYEALNEYAEGQLERHLLHESDINRSVKKYNDLRVHLALYFITPRQRSLSNVDISILSHLKNLTNVMIVICKADLMTETEMNSLKDTIKQQCQEHGIKLFDDQIHHSTRLIEHEGQLESKIMSMEYFPLLIEAVNDVYYEQYRMEKLANHKQHYCPVNNITTKLAATAL